MEIKSSTFREALLILFPTLDKTFDLVFIDADKPNYCQLLSFNY